jgi:FKBP-type peptidyl-prolyl cis-trans isomerase FklB
MTDSLSCEDRKMRNLLTTFVISSTAGIMLVGTLFAQQTPATSTQHVPAATTKKTTTAKRATAPTTKPGPLTLSTQQDKISYAIGMNMAKNLQRQSLDVEPDVVSRGLKDVLAGNKTLLTEDEAKATLTTLQNDMRAKQQEKVQQVGQANKKEGEDFLTANKGKDGVVTLPSGLQYKVLKEGTGPKPSASDSVVCNYRGTLINGTEFDSSYKRGQPATFPVSGVIKGWTEALQLMSVGSKWQLFIPPSLAYGERGAGADIGPNATLIFEVELISIQGKGQ